MSEHTYSGSAVADSIAAFASGVPVGPCSRICNACGRLGTIPDPVFGALCYRCRVAHVDAAHGLAIFAAFSRR